MARESALYPFAAARRRDRGSDDGAREAIGGTAMIPLGVGDAGAARVGPGRPAPARALVRVALQHLARRPRGADDPRFWKLGESVGELAGVGGLVAIRGAPEAHRVLHALRRVVEANHPRAGRGIVLVVPRVARARAAAQRRDTRRARW